MTKIEKQYRMWVYAAILLIRKNAAGRVQYAAVAPTIDKNTAFSFMQWAAAAGYISRSGEYVYEARNTSGMSMSEIFAAYCAG